MHCWVKNVAAGWQQGGSGGIRRSMAAQRHREEGGHGSAIVRALGREGSTYRSTSPFSPLLSSSNPGPRPRQPLLYPARAPSRRRDLMRTLQTSVLCHHKQEAPLLWENPCVVSTSWKPCAERHNNEPSAMRMCSSSVIHWHRGRWTLARSSKESDCMLLFEHTIEERHRQQGLRV